MVLFWREAVNLNLILKLQFKIFTYHDCIFRLCKLKIVESRGFFLRPISFIMLQKRKVCISSNLLKNLHGGSQSRIYFAMSANVV